jgi:5-methylthioadenosine/S-adenosylhomocysteine deaminase
MADTAKNIDTLIFADWIVTVDEDYRELADHAIAVHEGRILDILPADQARKQYQSENLHQLDGHALVPGFVNAHTHASMSLFRGLADDLPLMEWLQDHIWPAEGQWVNEEFIHDGTLHAAAEMIRSGTTCFNDMYFFPDVTARAIDSIGMRASVGLIVLDFPTVWASDPDEYISKGLEVHDHYRSNTRITTTFAPHAPYTVSNDPLVRIETLAEELDIPIHMHVHETAFEVKQAIDQNGLRPLSRLNDIGLISPRMLAVHMTQLTDEEIEILATNNANVVHCPESNLKLASGFCPLHKLLQAGVNVALGTDGTASNNDLDMIGEMRTAALLAKTVANNASAAPAHDILKMATINGAKALGLDNVIGSLEKGKSADIVAINMNTLETQPMYNVVSQLVYSTSRDQVSNVWVAGQQLLKNRVLMTMDENEIISKAHIWQQKIIANA